MKRLLVVVALLSAGCAGSLPKGPVAVPQSGDFTEQDITLTSGRTIHCLFWLSGAGQATDSGMSCDWTVAK